MQAVIEHVLPRANKHFQLVKTLIRCPPHCKLLFDIIAIEYLVAAMQRTLPELEDPTDHINEEGELCSVGATVLSC